ncbi:hypothetical protein TNCT_90111 [Trichonephila clavata]|uniref:Uncharacterized protein n=1 Tax=Trichonephila clavata TaxID=2740835 RepID=A0A8X6HLC4_TRICU|nr:hypothetical protein TNCT_90111 [Trichonephila clavata]
MSSPSELVASDIHPPLPLLEHLLFKLLVFQRNSDDISHSYKLDQNTKFFLHLENGFGVIEIKKRTESTAINKFFDERRARCGPEITPNVPRP